MFCGLFSAVSLTDCHFNFVVEAQMEKKKNQRKEKKNWNAKKKVSNAKKKVSNAFDKYLVRAWD